MCFVEETSAEVALSQDMKTVKLANVWLYCDLYGAHMRPRRTVMAPGDERLYSVLLPFHYGLNIAIIAVPHPA